MSKHILLVDDEIHIVRAAEFKFVRLGYDVVCASDGEDAWTQIQKRQPDIIVTDCQMPRLDGLGLAARVRANPRTAGIPMIMLSAKGFELSPEEIREKYGIHTLLPKPFSPRDLVRNVEQILEQTPAPA
jgi:two-component system alkaline phosphatase synthesis response regulator PhoP